MGSSWRLVCILKAFDVLVLVPSLKLTIVLQAGENFTGNQEELADHFLQVIKKRSILPFNYAPFFMFSTPTPPALSALTRTDLKNARCVQVHNIVDQSLECIECDYKARHSGHLREHINAEHRQMKYYCDLCDFQTKWKNRIKTHKVSVHKEGGLPCPSCDYTASEAWVLSQHVRVVHR